MVKKFLKIAGVKNEQEFYKKYPSEAAFFKAHPEAKDLKMYKKGGEMKKLEQLTSYEGDIDGIVPMAQKGANCGKSSDTVIKGLLSGTEYRSAIDTLLTKVGKQEGIEKGKTYMFFCFETDVCEIPEVEEWIKKYQKQAGSCAFVHNPFTSESIDRDDIYVGQEAKDFYNRAKIEILNEVKKRIIDNKPLTVHENCLSRSKI